MPLVLQELLKSLHPQEGRNKKRREREWADQIHWLSAASAPPDPLRKAARRDTYFPKGLSRANGRAA